MPKFVESMLKVFGRNKENKDRDRGSGKKTKRSRKSVLDADSFVFLPGDHVSRYWGALLNDDESNFPISQLAADYSDIRRRKTHIGLIHSDESGMQEVNIIRPRAKTNAHLDEENVLRNGKLFNRRLSGTLVKARKSTDEVEDGSVFHDYAFHMSDRERWSQDLSGRYVYDRLFCPPVKSSTPLKTSTPLETSSTPPQWKYPGDDAQMKNGTYERLKLNEKPIHRVPISKPAVCVTDHDNRLSTCEIDNSDEDNRVFHVKRASSRPSVGSHGYCDLEPLSKRFGSEYCMPADSIDWEDVRLRTWQGIFTFPTHWSPFRSSHTSWQLQPLVPHY